MKATHAQTHTLHHVRYTHAQIHHIYICNCRQRDSHKARTHTYIHTYSSHAHVYGIHNSRTHTYIHTYTQWSCTRPWASLVLLIISMTGGICVPALNPLLIMRECPRYSCVYMYVCILYIYIYICIYIYIKIHSHILE